MGIGGNTGGRKYSQHFFSIALQFRLDRFAINIKFQLQILFTNLHHYQADTASIPLLQQCFTLVVMLWAASGILTWN